MQSDATASDQQQHRIEPSTIIDILKDLSHEIRELDVGSHVDIIDSITPLHLLRDYISSNKPVVLRNAVSHWPALNLWSQQYLSQAAGDSLTTVAFTPDGRADAVTHLSATTPTPTTTSTNADDDKTHGTNNDNTNASSSSVFALPYERKMTLASFFTCIQHCLQHQTNLVPYLQFQNSSLTTELPMLLKDVGSHWPIATEALGQLPDAVNIWMGTRHSVTTWHKDPYENFYAIVTGSKTFHLLPPTDAYRMRLRKYPLAVWSPAVVVGDGIDGEGVEGLKELVLVKKEPEEEVTWSTIQTREPRFNEEDTSTSSSGDIDTSFSSQLNIQHTANNNTSTNNTKTTNTNNTTYNTIDSTTNSSTNSTENMVWNDASLPRPLTVTIYPGDVLYLPGNWWHEVHQNATTSGTTTNNTTTQASSEHTESGINGENEGDDITIAVNFWYDMRFDAKHAFLTAAEALAVAAGLNEPY